jgi:hypothetical protein
MPGKHLILIGGGVDEGEANAAIMAVVIDLVKPSVKRFGAKGIEEEQRRRFRVVELLCDTVVNDHGRLAPTYSLRIGRGCPHKSSE